MEFNFGKNRKTANNFYENHMQSVKNTELLWLIRMMMCDANKSVFIPTTDILIYVPIACTVSISGNKIIQYMETDMKIYWREKDIIQMKMTIMHVQGQC